MLKGGRGIRSPDKTRTTVWKPTINRPLVLGLLSHRSLVGPVQRSPLRSLHNKNVAQDNAQQPPPLDPQQPTRQITGARNRACGNRTCEQRRKFFT